MDMFTRDMVLQGPPAEVRQWAGDIAAAFTDATGRQVATWQGLAGGTAGRITWAMAIEGIEDSLALTVQAMADQAYLDAIEDGRHLFGGNSALDTVHARVNGELGEDASRPGNLIGVIQATARAGHLGEALGWAVEAADFGQRAHGHEVAVMNPRLGTFSQVTFLTLFKDAAEAQKADSRLRSDPDYGKLLARGGPHFVDASASQQLYLRIA